MAAYGNFWPPGTAISMYFLGQSTSWKRTFGALEDRERRLKGTLEGHYSPMFVVDELMAYKHSTEYIFLNHKMGGDSGFGTMAMRLIE